MGQHVLLHVPGSPQLLVADVTLVIPTDVVSLGEVVLVVSLVVKL